MNQDSARSPRLPVLSLVEAIATPAAAVRPDRVREARTRVEGGYYDRADVRRALVAALLDQLVASS